MFYHVQYQVPTMYQHHSCQKPHHCYKNYRHHIVYLSPYYVHSIANLGGSVKFFARNCGRSWQMLPERLVEVGRCLQMFADPEHFTKKRGPRNGPLSGVLTDVVAKSKVYPGELKNYAASCSLSAGSSLLNQPCLVLKSHVKWALSPPSSGIQLSLLARISRLM